MKKLISLFFIGAFAGISCTDDSPAPVPTPTAPNNELSAMINRTAWETAAPIGSPEIDAEHYSGNYFDVTGFNYTGQGISHLFIKVYGLNDTGIFVLDDVNLADYYDSPNNRHYSTDAMHAGILHVTEFDYEQAKITGEFEFVGRDTVSGDSVEVTSGRISNVSFHKY